VSHNTAVSPGWSEDPDTYLAGSADSTGDYVIGMGFYIGTLLDGESIKFMYSYAVAASPNDFSFGRSYGLIGSTTNQHAVGGYLDDNSTGAPVPLQAILDVMGQLTDEDVQIVLNQLSGGIYGSLPAASLQHSSFYLSQMATRLRSQMVPYNYSGGATFAQTPADVTLASWENDELVIRGQNRLYSRAGSWISGYGLGGTAQGDGNADGFRYGVGGTQLGIQTQLNDVCSIGGWANLAWSNIQGDQLNEIANVENYHFGTYLTAFDGDDYYMFIGGLGYDHGKVRRQLDVGGVTGLAQGQYDGWQANAYLERGLSLHHYGWNLQPYAALQYLYLRQGSLEETGAGIMNLAVDGLDVHSLRSVIGGRFSHPIVTQGGRRLSPELRAAWLHEFLDTNQLVSAGFADLGGAGFAVRGLDLGRDWAMLGGGLNYEFQPGARLFGGYDVQFNDNQAFHVGSGGVELLW